MSLDDCKVIKLPRIGDPRGSLTFIEGCGQIPFDIKRVFYIYDVPTSEGRGAHAHKELQQFIVCLSGSFHVEMDDGTTKKSVHLNRPWQGLYVPPMIWSREINFDMGSVCMVLTSDIYKESDYYRNYADYLLALGNK